MFEFIKGRVDYIGPAFVVIEANGVGFQISTPNPFSFKQEVGQVVKIYTYHHVRQDFMALYGFHSREEKTLFIKLLDVTGIGPKGALAILAAGEPEQVVQAIENEDEAFLVKFPGVGKKTARQIILDLKGKLQNIVPDFFPNLFSADQIPDMDSGKLQEFEEAMLALQALGYSEKEIKKISPALKKEKLTTDQYIKKALQMLLR
ncbi:Holliday junction branch migration protein RuvA [Cytobacillus eiseniae]|uniref:Holliday junction branch migration protein RuvA n=1 Tax=Cytobacillus eiseniae TaxID=762947 RepID=UPI00082E7334|nr:Holliday junction branch migration protein RuvA [Cytobacillus eiseniae]